MPKRTRDYEEYLLKQLKDPEFAALYLNAALEDTDEGNKERFLMALGYVAKAHGMTRIAKETKLAREAMYRTLSKKGNPEFGTFLALIRAIGLRLTLEVKQKA